MLLLAVLQPARSDARQADVDRLRGIMAEFDAAMSAKDPARVIRLFATDCVSMPPGMQPIRGRAALESSVRGFLGDQKTVRLDTIVEDVLVDGDLAVVRARFTMRTGPRDGGPADLDEGNWLLCFRRVRGDWQIVWDVYNSTSPPPGE